MIKKYKITEAKQHEAVTKLDGAQLDAWDRLVFDLQTVVDWCRETIPPYAATYTFHSKEEADNFEQMYDYLMPYFVADDSGTFWDDVDFDAKYDDLPPVPEAECRHPKVKKVQLFAHSSFCWVCETCKVEVEDPKTLVALDFFD